MMSVVLEILDELKAGVSTQELALRYSISQAAVCNYPSGKAPWSSQRPTAQADALPRARVLRGVVSPRSVDLRARVNLPRDSEYDEKRLEAQGNLTMASAGSCHFLYDFSIPDRGCWS